MRKFEVPKMNVMKLSSDDVLTNSTCRVEALGCDSCYCTVIECDDHHPECPGCFSDWDS